MPGIENKELILHHPVSAKQRPSRGFQQNLVDGLKEMIGVLWAYRTTAHKSTGISPFALTYGMEAIILIEIGIPTLRTDMPESLSIRSIIKDPDTADELHETTAVRVASYHRRLKNLYNKCVKPRVFQLGDLILRKVFENTADPMAGKFQANWEGPYIVTRADKSGS